MTPAARIQAVIEILEALTATQKPADRFLRDWFRARRYAGSKDRAAVSERVFQVLRHRASLAWRMQNESPRAIAIASLLREGETNETIAALFDGKGYGPQPLTDSEHAAIAAPERNDPPANVRGEFPAFLEPELTRAFGTALIKETKAFADRASVDLRVNTLKAERDDVLAQLITEGIAAEPAPYAPHAIRIEGHATANLGRHALHESGAFEFQDEAAQIAALLCNARPNTRVLDLAAGAGGKSLALAAEMQNHGEIVACDIRPAALEELHDRAKRAGATIIRTHIGDPPKGEFDLVLVDAPCSGSGTWRRQPELKWRLTSERLLELARTQDMLLAQAAQRVRPGGLLVYATCSILPLENEDRIAEFLKTTEGFSPVPALNRWRGDKVPPGLGETFRASPAKTGTDGFFAAILKRAV